LGNVLTKITKWSAGLLFGLSIILTILNAQQRKQTHSITIPKELPTSSAPAAPAAAAPTVTVPAVPTPAAEVPATAPAAPAQ
jgi:preprotein translocase subunit SecG